MKNIELDINQLEKEIRYLYADYTRMISRSEAVHEIKVVRLKIKHAEETLRLKKRILYMSLN